MRESVASSCSSPISLRIIRRQSTLDSLNRLKNLLIESLDFQLGTITGAILAGVACGMAPLLTGLFRQQLTQGAIGFAVCVVAAFHLGFLLALPVALVFSVVIASTSPLPLAQRTLQKQLWPLAVTGSAAFGYQIAQSIRVEFGLSGSFHGAVFGGAGALVGAIILYTAVHISHWTTSKYYD